MALSLVEGGRLSTTVERKAETLVREMGSAALVWLLFWEVEAAGWEVEVEGGGSGRSSSTSTLHMMFAFYFRRR
jgi:hypothetical protein